MTAVYVADFDKQCRSKRKYSTSKDAKRAARSLMTTGGRAAVVYHCNCGWWHCGHPTAWRRRLAATQLQEDIYRGVV